LNTDFSIFLKFTGKLFPEILADVETIGFLKREINS
jgi:hypothetical protein